MDKYCEGNYNLAKLDVEGQRINIDINFEVGDRKIVFTSGWMVRPKGEITNNTPLADWFVEEIMKYLDLVELIREKDSYTKAGVKVGDFGAVMSERAENGKWQVIFSEFYTGKDIADIMVNEDDLKIHEFVPKDRYPKK